MAKGDEETGLFFRRSLENGVVLDIYAGFSNVAHKDNGVMNEASGDDDTDSEGSNEDDDNVDGDHSVHEVDGIVNEANGDDYTNVLEAELDNEKFYSDSDSDTNDTRIRRHNLHNLRRSNENMGNENMANFYLGKIKIVKDDRTRVRALCQGDRYQVSGKQNHQRVVDLNKKICACRRWEITGMSYRHAVAALWFMGSNGQKEHAQVPITLTPPKHHNQVGRPKKARKRSSIEIEEMTKGGRLSKKNTKGGCSKCGNKGHNKRTCKGQGG
ncbi:hypothetical protein QVD17_08367 [Tagetes erecta]|uniref:CCHC-type domain-containing protein n=1 Tax=Tagetes erecta TaxID=13708 RepID=A0AAD8KZ10_TARER|nr:hypothetical protein QVD17_08367 [Tagetes erecta]